MFDWLKQRRTTRLQYDTMMMEEWRHKYFGDIVFPIIILKTNDYIGVSDLEEYYYDVDINIWFIDPSCELIDATGQIYKFKQIEENQWVPNSKIGTVKFEDLKKRVAPLLYMPTHKKNINSVKTIKNIIELMLTD